MMRTNLPVTNREEAVPDGTRLISTTNSKGVIESANAAFTRIAGFTMEELAGKPHNIVRHPDMPEAVYKEFWDVLKTGKPWMGVIKNRCKNGDHYWVSGFISPVFSNGVQTGYQSVRNAATEPQKQRAEALYARIRAGKSVKPWWVIGSLQVRIAALAGLGAGLCALATLAAAVLPQAAQLGLTALGLLVAVGGPLTVCKRLAHLSTESRKIFGSDVCRVTYGAGHDAVADAELAFAMQRSQINALRGRVEDLTDALGGAAKDMRKAADGGNAAIDSQSGEIDQVVTAIEEMAATVQEISRNTAEASSATYDVAKQAENGRETVTRSTDAMRGLAENVGQTAKAMEQLREETRSIGKVLEVINGIAAQTNLLALNAAIEAARAGESGRGFAVVATEVRELAGRVSQSTGDISNMIAALESRAESAVENMRESHSAANVVADDAQQSSQAIIDIQTSVERIRDMNMQIATAAEEQSSVAEEINRRVNVVNDNMRSSQEMSKLTKDTSEELVGMVDELRGVLIQFDTK